VLLEKYALVKKPHCLCEGWRYYNLHTMMTSLKIIASCDALGTWNIHFKGHVLGI